MSKNHSVLGEKAKAYVCTARSFDDTMGEFGHTAQQRGAFGRLSRRKCSAVPAPPCALRLKFTQNRSRLNKSINGHHGLANPALGDFRSLPDVERQALQAQKVPSRESSFRNLILNQRVSAHARFINKAEWEACGAAVDIDSLKGRECFAALDLGATRDLTALVLIFPDDAGGADVWPVFFMPEHNLGERSNEDRVPYELWAKAGHITAIPGATIDPSFVAAVIADMACMFDLKALAYDRWRIEDLKRELEAIGCRLELVPHGQGFKDMSPAVDLLERHVAEALIRYGNNPVLKMCAVNAVITADAAGNRKLDKAKAKGRIDGLVSLAMALSLQARYEDKNELPACLVG